MAGSILEKHETTWGREVRRLIRRPGERISAELEACYGVKHRRAVITRWLSGERTPDGQTVERINAVVGKLIGTESARQYLDAEARYCELLDADEATLVAEGARSFELVIDAIHPERVEQVGKRVGQVFGRLEPATRQKLLLNLHRTHRRMLCNALEGRVPAKDAYDELSKVFAKHGLSIEQVLDESKGYGNAEKVRLEAALRVKIMTALALYAPDATAFERFGLTRAIDRAYSAYMQELPAFKVVDFQGPHFFGAVAMAHRRKQKLGVVPERVARAYETAKQKRQRRNTVRKFMRDFPDGSPAEEEFSK